MRPWRHEHQEANANANANAGAEERKPKRRDYLLYFIAKAYITKA